MGDLKENEQQHSLALSSQLFAEKNWTPIQNSKRFGQALLPAYSLGLLDNTVQEFLLVYLTISKFSAPNIAFLAF